MPSTPAPCSPDSLHTWEEACLGTISEIFDGDAPHQPRGCFAQAWSVAETLRAWSVLARARAAADAAGGRRRPTGRSLGTTAPTAEDARLAARFPAGEGWKQWGPYLSRAPVGHGARGLQRRRQRLGVLSARPRPQPRLPLGRGRHRRRFATTSSACAWRWPCGTARDPILKERLFGLTNGEGNHGEDVKELYYYLDATPTHSYLKMLYKYPQRAFPYAQLVEENRAARQGPAGVRAARHGHLRRRPLLRRVRRVRQGRARTTS